MSGPFITDLDDLEGRVLVRERRQAAITDETSAQPTAILSEGAPAHPRH